jgi:hypothetical protein
MDKSNAMGSSIMTDAIYDSEAARSELHRKMDIEIAKLVAETSKINAETSRINQEMATYPWLPILMSSMTAILGSTGVIGAIVALVIASRK